MTLPFDHTHDLDPGVEISRSKSEMALSQEWDGRLTWNEKDESHPFMTMILTSVSLVGWVDVPGSDWVTSDVGMPSTYLVLSNHHDSFKEWEHYSDVIISAIASKIDGGPIVCSTVCSAAVQRKHQSFASPAFMRGVPFDDVIMTRGFCLRISNRQLLYMVSTGVNVYQGRCADDDHMTACPIGQCWYSCSALRITYRKTVVTFKFYISQ